MDDSPRAAAWYEPECRTWTSMSRATTNSIAKMRTRRISRTRRVNVPFSQSRPRRSRAVLAGRPVWVRALRAGPGGGRCSRGQDAVGRPAARPGWAGRDGRVPVDVARPWVRSDVVLALRCRVVELLWRAEPARACPGSCRVGVLTASSSASSSLSAWLPLSRWAPRSRHALVPLLPLVVPPDGAPAPAEGVVGGGGAGAGVTFGVGRGTDKET